MAALEQYIRPTKKFSPRKNYVLGVPNGTHPARKYEKSKKDFFAQLLQAVARWQSETAFTSSLDEILEHPDYKQIVELGDFAVDVLISELHKGPSLLVYALEDITGEAPYLDAELGNIQAMSESWISWADSR